MGSIQKSLRLPEEVVKDIEALASHSGRVFSGFARDLLIEAVKIIQKIIRSVWIPTQLDLFPINKKKAINHLVQNSDKR
jgi:hypothetical protein